MFGLDRLEGVTDEYEDRGMSPTTGRFQKGNKFGRPKGKRNAMTQAMLDRVAQAGLSPDEVLIDIYQDPTIPPDLRFKAASKIADLVYPKAASIEVKMDDHEAMTEEQMENKIRDFLSIELGNDVLPPTEDDEDDSTEDDSE